jgi:hypothetical protein
MLSWRLISTGEKKHLDVDGAVWDCMTKAALDISYVTDPEGPEGLCLKGFHMFADFSTIIGEAIKRGVIPVGALVSQGA